MFTCIKRIHFLSESLQGGLEADLSWQGPCCVGPMNAFFCTPLLIVTALLFSNINAEASSAHCYETSSMVSSSALIRNKWRRGSSVCGRFTPNNKIESKGDCRNAYCPVVLDGSTNCGKRGWIHQSLIKQVVCETGEETAVDDSLKPRQRVARPRQVVGQTVADTDDVGIDISPVEPARPVQTAPAASGDQISCYESTANYLNVRYKAGLRNRSCGKMMRGDKLASKGDCEDGWCPVEIKNCGGRGWISERFLESKMCNRADVSSDFGLSAGVYWQDESFSNIGMRPGLMGENPGGSSSNCTDREIRESRCQRLIKMNAHAALGMCLPDGDAINLEALMEKHKINAYSGYIPRLRRAVRDNERSRIDLKSPRNAKLRRALSKTLLALDRIGDGLPHLTNGRGVNIIFDNGNSPSGPSRRYGNQIQLRQGNQNRRGCAGHSSDGGIDNIALIVHELGHYIGNSSGYAGLMRATGGRYCMVSNYADNNRGEHFSEVLAAYVLMPERFKNKGSACDKAFNYMKGLFGEPNMTKSCIARKRSYTVPGTGRYDENNNPQSDDSVTWILKESKDLQCALADVAF